MSSQSLFLVCSLANLFFVVSWHEPLLDGAKISPSEALALGKDADASSQKTFLRPKRHLATACLVCDDKDYSEPCPLDWHVLSREGGCRAPPTYSGLCDTEQSFIGASAEKKEEIELICGVCWPCKETPACARDWAAPCPYGYSPTDIPFDQYGDDTVAGCAADIFYEGQCDSEVSFADVDQKRAFAKRCSTNWPCKSACESTAQSQCPTDWTHLGDGLCASPNYYKVAGCPLLQHFGGWTEHMKSEFADKCSVHWPCDEESVEMTKEKSMLVQFMTLPNAVRCWAGAPVWVRTLAGCSEK